MSERDPRPGEQGANAAGVDVTLIDEMLRMSVKERLEQNDRMAAQVVKLRAAFGVATGKDGWKNRGG